MIQGQSINEGHNIIINRRASQAQHLSHPILCDSRCDLDSGYSVNPVIWTALVIIRGDPGLDGIDPLETGTGGMDAA